jgi:hypothetical protein
MYVGTLTSVSNREDWEMAFQLWDKEADEYIDITGCVVTLTVADERDCSILTGSSAGSYVTLEGDGIIRAIFPAASMSNVCAGTYKVGVRITKESIPKTVQLFVGTLSVVEGVDRQ